MFPICLQLAAGKTWQSLIYTVYTYGLICIYIRILFNYNYHHYHVAVTYIYILHIISLFSMLTKNYVHTDI